MATDFEVDGHTLLQGEAEDLGSTDLGEQVSLAADLLELSGLSLAGARKEKAERALALQVSFQAASGVDAALYFSKSKGDKDADYANSPLKPFTGIDPRAEALASSLRAAVDAEAKEGGDGWAITRSLR